MGARREAGLRTGVGGEAGGRARQSGRARVRVALEVGVGVSGRAAGELARGRAGGNGRRELGQCACATQAALRAGRHLPRQAVGSKTPRVRTCRRQWPEVPGTLGGGADGERGPAAWTGLTGNGGPGTI